MNELNKLKISSDDGEFEGDVKDLIASFEDQLDTLDAITKAAKQDDQAAVDTRISKLNDQVADSNDLAESLEVRRCQLDPVFDATPATTESDVPLTLPIATLPDGTAYFVVGVGNVVLWDLSPSADLLQPALQAWGESVSQ